MNILNDIHIYQIVVVAISSVMLFQGIKEFTRREAGQTLLKLIVRLTIWGGMAAIAVYPDSTYSFSALIGIDDNITAVVVTGFIFVFLIIFKLLSAIEKLEQNMSELTRRESLKEAHSRIEKLREEVKAERTKP